MPDWNIPVLLIGERVSVFSSLTLRGIEKKKRKQAPDYKTPANQSDLIRTIPIFGYYKHATSGIHSKMSQYHAQAVHFISMYSSSYKFYSTIAYGLTNRCVVYHAGTYRMFV